MSHKLRRSYDIIINGGGIVGFTLLSKLKQSPYLNRLKVLLIEQSKKPISFEQSPRLADGDQEAKESEVSPAKKFSNRVSSITSQSRDSLQELGVWSYIREYSKDVHDIKVWNYEYGHRISFNNNQGDIMFSVVENDRLSKALLKSIYGIHPEYDLIKWDSKLLNLEGSTNEGLIDVSVLDNERGKESQISAPLVLGCDGFRSKVRNLSRIDYKELDLNKMAVVGTVKMDTSSRGTTGKNSTAFQRFSNSNDTVAALLPLNEEYSSFVISAPSHYAKHLSECNDELFIYEVNRLLAISELPENPILNYIHMAANSTCDITRSLLQSAMISNFVGTPSDTSEYEEPPRLVSVVDGSRAVFPLYFGTTTPKMIAKLPGRDYSQIALLGDSSHRVHPLAGQGLNLGIQDAIELVDQLEQIAKTGARIFDERDLSSLDKALKRFELRRQAYIVPMLAGIYSMPSLFKLMPSRMISGIDRCSYIKASSVKIANGC